MLKNVIVLILLTLGLIFGSQHINPLIQVLLSAHDWISQLLLQVFAGGQVGSIARQLIASIAMPLVLGLIPTGVYWMAKKRLFPYFLHVVWVVWIIQSTAMVMVSKAPVV